MKKLFTKKNLKEFFFINIGVFLMAAAYSLLLDPNNIVIGGVGGIATIMKDITGISSSLFIFILNGVLLIVALIFVDRSFFLKTIYASLIYPVYSYLCELLYKNFLSSSLPNILKFQIDNPNLDTNIASAGAYLVVVIFGAVITGFGLGLAIRNGSSTGGVDIIQKILLKYCKIPFSVSLIIIDGSIVFASGIYFHNAFVILYGAIFIFVSGYVMDSIIFSGFNARCVNIVTTKPEEIKEQIFKILGRGITIVAAKGGYTGNDKTILVCVMHNQEFYKMKEIIRSIDEKAFIYITRASEVHGEGFSPEIVGSDENTK
ncbi:MAG: YitT family protein [Mollicutes bacterium]|nr:YitT family protein [Mollicutes bacterium]